MREVLKYIGVDMILMIDLVNLKMQVTKKHFKDLAYIRVAGESTSPQQLIVYTDSNDDRDLLMVRHEGFDHKEILVET